MVMGGFDQKTNISTAMTHRFSLSQNKWCHAPNMNSKRSSAGATYLDGFIYAFFGITNSGTVLNSVERIETTTFEKWHLMQINNEILIPRVGFGAIPLNKNEIITFSRNQKGPVQESF